MPEQRRNSSPERRGVLGSAPPFPAATSAGADRTGPQPLADTDARRASILSEQSGVSVQGNRPGIVITPATAAALLDRYEMEQAERRRSESDDSSDSDDGDNEHQHEDGLMTCPQDADYNLIDILEQRDLKLAKSVSGSGRNSVRNGSKPGSQTAGAPKFNSFVEEIAAISPRSL